MNQIQIKIQLLEKSEPHLGIVFGTYGIYVKGLAFPTRYVLNIPSQIEWEGWMIARITPLAITDYFKMKIPAINKRRTFMPVVGVKFIDLDRPSIYGEITDVERKEIAEIQGVEINDAEGKIEDNDLVIFYKKTEQSKVEIFLPFELLRALAEKSKNVSLSRDEEMIEIPVEFDNPRLLPPFLLFEYENPETKFSIDLDPILRKSVKGIAIYRDEEKIVFFVDTRKIIGSIGIKIEAKLKDREEELLNGVFSIYEESSWRRFEEVLGETIEEVKKYKDEGKLEKLIIHVPPQAREYIESKFWFLNELNELEIKTR